MADDELHQYQTEHKIIGCYGPGDPRMKFAKNNFARQNIFIDHSGSGS